MKSKVLAGVMVAVLSLSVLGCGSTGNESDSEGTTASPITESQDDTQDEGNQADDAQNEESNAGDAAGETVYAYQQNTDPATLSIYISDPGTVWEDWGKDPVSQRIMEATNITFDPVAPVTGDDTLLSMLISSDDLPDIVTDYYTSSSWQTMINEGQLCDLEELAREYAPELLNLVDQEAWDACRSEDGHVYYLSSCFYTTDNLELFRKYNGIVQSNQPCLVVRQDYYEELGSPEIKNAQEFMEFCEQLKEAHPDHIPFYTGSLTSTGPSYLAYMFGVCSYYVDENLNVSKAYRNPAYLDMYIWFNEMVRKGLVGEESFVDEDGDKDTKIAQGQPSAFLYNVAYTGAVPGDNPDTIYYPMKPWDTYEHVRANAGYIRFGVSKKCENKEAAARWLEFGNTHEGAEIMCLGIEGSPDEEWSGDLINGPHFYYEPDGDKGTMYEGFVNARLADWVSVEKTTGIEAYANFVTVDNWLIAQGRVVSTDVMNKMNEWFNPYVRFDSSLFFNFPAGSDELVINQSITKLIGEYHVKWAYAESEEEVRSLYEEFLQKCEEAGEATLNQYLTESYKEQGGSTPTPVK